MNLVPAEKLSADTIIAFSGVNGNGDWLWNLTETAQNSNKRNVVVTIRGGGPYLANGGVLATIDDSEILGGWHHYALVFKFDENGSKSRWTFYLDGVNRGSQLMNNHATNQNVQHDRFQLGGAGSGSKKVFDAKLAFWRVSDEALPSGSLLCHQTFATTVAYWPMNVFGAFYNNAAQMIVPDAADERNTLMIRDTTKGGVSYTAHDIGWTTPPNPDADLTAAGVSCWSNNLKTLDVSHNPGLSWLDCSVNKITVLDVSKCPALVALVKGNKRQQNKAEKLDYFYANGNQLLIDPWVKVIAGDFVSAGTEKVPDSIAQEEKEKKPFTKKISGIKFKLDPAKKTAEFIGPVDKKTTKAGVPDTIKAGGVTYKVTKIAAKAFSGCTKLTKVTIGKNVTEIGASAFQGCSALKSVTIPSKVSKIGASAFYKCKKLAEINVKTRKLKSGSVGKNAFKGISSKAVFKCPSKTLRTTYKKLFTAAGAPKKAKYK